MNEGASFTLLKTGFPPKWSAGCRLLADDLIASRPRKRGGVGAVRFSPEFFQGKQTTKLRNILKNPRPVRSSRPAAKPRPLFKFKIVSMAGSAPVRCV